MSADLYSTLLVWSGRHGTAKLHGKSFPLDAAPDLGAGKVWAMEYCPEIGIREIQPTSLEPRRNMLWYEVKAADVLLLKLAGVLYVDTHPLCGSDGSCAADRLRD